MPVSRIGVSLSPSCVSRAGACIALALLLAGCGGGSSGSSSQSLPVITSVSVSGPAYTQAGFCANFTTTVSGTGSYDRSVQWYVNGVAGGSTTDGLISTSGSYCAPAQPPSGNPVSIKAIANGDTTKFGSTITRVVAISISPSQTQMNVGATQQFSATAIGGVTNLIQWEVNGIAGGNASIGTITTTGLYTAPTQLTNVGISVEAALAEAPSLYAGAGITLSAQIVISPQDPQLTYGSTQQFSATINGSPVQVNWAATYGSINSSGLYTATGTQTPDTVRAWLASGNANGSTTVQIAGLRPTITSISPQPATAGDQITIAGTNLNPRGTVVFSDAIGGTIPVGVYTVGNGTFTVTVPQGAISGPLYVITQQGSLAPVQSNTLQFQRLARLRIRSPQRDLSEGESVTLQYALLGDSTPQTVTFSADIGSFNGATYQAPSVLSADTFAHVTACISGTQSCDILILGLHPFRIAPDVPLVGIGQSLQLSAILGGGGTGANWNLLAGGGSLTPSGLYNAGTNEIAAGPAIVSATSNGAMEETTVGVTGAFPGLLNRIVDYFDEHQPNASGTFADGLVIIGNRMYVAASNHLGAYTDSYFWIDVYDTTNPLQPVWLTAVEANSSGPVFAVGKYLYSYQNVDIAVPGSPNPPNTITIYQLQSGIPVLRARTTTLPQWWSINDNQGVLTLVIPGVSSTSTAEIVIYDVTSGVITSQDLNITLPSDANSFGADSATTVGNRLFVSVSNNDLSLPGYILTYDLTTSPPVLLGNVNGRSLAFYASANFLFGALGGMDTYDISAQLPQYLSHVDGVNAAQLRGTQLLARTQQQGFRMFDTSSPQTPTQTAILFDGIITGYDISQWAGNYVYEAQGDGGIAIFDATQTGGPVAEYSVYGGPHLSVTANDMLWRSPYLYAATGSYDGAVLSIYDTTVNPINRIGEYLDVNQQGVSVQAAGNYVYFGMTQNMAVLNVSQPSSPSLVATVPVPAASLAIAGNTLYAGTLSKGLVAMDISNPAAPATLSASLLPAVPVKMRVVNNLLMIADGTGGLLVYDISSPTSPILLSQTTAFAAVNDVAVNGTTAFIAADVDGLGILDISNPAHPVLVSKTSLSTIDPFDSLSPLNETISIGINNGLVYVGTLNDNGLVFGLDCANLPVPRIVSKYAYGDFVETAVGSLLFNGNELLVGGAINSGVYPIEVVDISQPFDSIEEFFPPVTLQNPAPISMIKHGFATPYTGRGPNSIRRFHNTFPDPTDHPRALYRTEK